MRCAKFCEMEQSIQLIYKILAEIVVQQMWPKTIWSNNFITYWKHTTQRKHRLIARKVNITSISVFFYTVHANVPFAWPLPTFFNSRQSRLNLNFNYILHSIFGFITARQGSIAPVASWREEKAQTQAFGATSKFVLHGCQMSRML